MARNKTGGKRWKKEKHDTIEVQDTILKDDHSGYGYVEKTYGNGRFNLICEDGKSRMGIIRGSLRNRVWITNGVLVLYGKREYQDDKVDIVHVYNNENVNQLFRTNEIDQKLYNLYTCCNDNPDRDDEDTAIDFDDSDLAAV